MTFPRQPTGWLQQCTAPSQGTQKTNQQCTAPSQGTQKTMLCAQRLCPANIGGCWWWCWRPRTRFSPREINPEWVRNPFIPVPEVQTPNDRRCNGDRGAEQHTVQWTFVVPGAQNFVKMLKASNYTYSAWCTELCMSARGTLGLMCHCDWHWIPQVRSCSFLPFFYCTTLPLQIGVGVLLFSAFYFLVSVIFLHILILSISNYTVIFFILSSNCRIKFHLFLSDKIDCTCYLKWHAVILYDIQKVYCLCEPAGSRSTQWNFE